MTTHPLPAAALDDRLGFTGTAGSGKTYNAGSAAERLLAGMKRVVIPDPLGVWWGLRLAADGKSKGFDIVIFGGPHGDLPLTEQAGALIGETVAGMTESCILDLSELGTKAAERRFMLAFLTALYRKASGEPVHVIFDEADMWAPQRLMDRDGDAARLLGMMETIVRRGRVKGFIPWLITQRPAVLSKDVLSQVDGLVSFKLTSSQDRDAIGNWVEGQADKAKWREIWASMPTLERGQGVIWLPSRGILTTASFPKKATFDSSATPKRGEKRKAGAQLKPLNLDRLKERLANVQVEAAHNDPKMLRQALVQKNLELAELRKQLADAVAKKVVADPDAIKKAEERGFEQAKKKLAAAAKREMNEARKKALLGVRAYVSALVDTVDADLAEIRKEQAALAIEFVPAAPQAQPTAARPAHRQTQARPPKRPASSSTASENGALAKGERACLIAIAQRESGATREMLTVQTGYKRSARDTYLQRLSARELVATEGRGAVRASSNLFD